MTKHKIQDKFQIQSINAQNEIPNYNFETCKLGFKICAFEFIIYNL
jgi:hypothetical protein